LVVVMALSSQLKEPVTAAIAVGLGTHYPV
jgi:hypothetical protein